MKSAWYIPAVALTLAILFSPAVRAEDDAVFSPYIEAFPNGKIDWDEGVIYGAGKGYLDVNGNDKNKALRAAQTLALQSILKTAAGVRLNDRQTVESFGDGRFVVHLRAMIHYQERDTRFHENVDRPYIEVTRTAPIKGVRGLTSEILTRLKSASMGWTDFPISAPEPEADDEPETWLVLDARKLSGADNVVPALFPKIEDTAGNVLYDVNRAEESALTERGMARYVISDLSLDRLESKKSSAERLVDALKKVISPDVALAGEKDKKRKKRKRFIVKEVADAKGLKKTNLVINEKDAKSLKKQDPSSKILKKCRVIVVANGPMGGIEGALDNYWAQF